jgi:hypothetical protein
MGQQALQQWEILWVLSVEQVGAVGAEESTAAGFTS